MLPWVHWSSLFFIFLLRGDSMELLLHRGGWCDARSHAPAQGLVEYGLILAFVSFVAILGIFWMGPAVSSIYSSASVSV